MGSNVVETGRFREKFSISSNEFFVYIDATQGSAHGPSVTLHFGLTPSQARELAYRVLAAAEECGQKTESK